MVRYGTDGYYLLEQVHGPGAPGWLRELQTQLEHNIAAAAINMIRIDAYWTGHPLDRTRSSHLARLDFTLTA
jgi:hypothetical protein